MRAIVKAKPEPGLWMQNVEVPQVGPNDVLIKIIRTSICGTDLHIDAWDEWAQATITHTGTGTGAVRDLVVQTAGRGRVGGKRVA